MILTPGPSMLEAMRNARLNWADALAELVDNSMDAGATRVEIEIGPGRRLVVRDDGLGCDSIEKMLTIGVHYRRSTTRLGRYGVGLKDAACWLWGRLEIRSIASGLARVATIDWDSLARTSDWSTPDPSTEPTKERGTVLRFDSIQRSMPDAEKLASDLGFTFTPAIHSGRQIIVKTNKRSRVCQPYELPPLESTVEDQFSVNGKGVRIRVGIVKDGHENRHPGFIYYHAHRVLFAGSLGSDGYSTNRIAGTCQLDRAWQLGKNKTEVQGADELGDAVFQRCKDILEQAQLQARSLHVQQLTDRVTARVREMFSSRIGREKRNSPKHNTGSVVPMHTGRKRVQVSQVQPGERKLLSRAAGSLTIDWADSLGNDQEMARAETTPSRITFNLQHLHVKHIHDTSNEDAIVQLAISCFFARMYEENEQDKFPFARNYSRMTDAWSALLASRPSFETRERKGAAS